MADLTNIEKAKLEKLFGMSSGYVMDFSNRTIQEFVLEHTGKDLYSGKYDYGSGSKANLIRRFWKDEPNYIVGKLIIALVEEKKTNFLLRGEPMEGATFDLVIECEKIGQRLHQNVSSSMEVFEKTEEDKDFSLLAKLIREMIEKNQPEAALDRLHTYTVKNIRRLCDKHGIPYDQGKPLHSCYGEYVKYLGKNGIIESEMTEKILKYAITILDAFNHVRNNQSFAHDNKILNYNESLLIFNTVSAVLGFIDTVEAQKVKAVVASDDDSVWEPPF